METYAQRSIRHCIDMIAPFELSGRQEENGQLQFYQFMHSIYCEMYQRPEEYMVFPKPYEEYGKIKKAGSAAEKGEGACNKCQRKLTEIQRQNLGNNIDKMVETIIDAVNNSERQVDLSAYALNSQMFQGAFQISAYIDPLVEIAAFEEDNDMPGVFYIDYGCSIEEHRSMVKEFDQRMESIVKECAGEAKTDIEYAMAVFQYLADFCQYDYDNYASAGEAGITSEESARRYGQMSVYRVLMDGSGVCRQFTRAFSLLLQQADIPAYEIAGMSNVPFASNNVIYNGRTEGELFGINHMWNLMQLSGEWYGADVTFAVSAKESANGAPDAVIWQYFGMNDAAMQENFPSDISITALYQNIPIPPCGEELVLPEKEQMNKNRNAGSAVPESGQKEKNPTEYEMVRLSEAEDGEVLVLDFGEDDAVYCLTITLPEGYTQEKAYPVCYLLGKEADREAAALSSEVIFVKISEASEDAGTASAILEERDFSQNPAVFFNRFLYGMIEAVEKEYSVDTVNRTLCGEGLGANICLYILFQNDKLANHGFSHYICLNPNLYYAAGGKSLMVWEDEYFQRCQELPVLLTITENNSADSGQNARTDLFKNIIKKREYRNLILEFE